MKKAFGLSTQSLPTSGCWPRCVNQEGLFLRIWTDLHLQTSLIHYLIRTISIFLTESRRPPAYFTGLVFLLVLRIRTAERSHPTLQRDVVQYSLWAALRNNEHRMKHWLQLVAIPNSEASSYKQELQEMRKRVADLEKTRSRSPRRNTQNKQAAIAGLSFLVLPASSSAPAQGSKGGKGSSNKKKVKEKGNLRQLLPRHPALRQKISHTLCNFPTETRSLFIESFHKNEICYNFLRKNCKKAADFCKFAHICARCGGSKACVDCMCLSTKEDSLPSLSLL